MKINLTLIGVCFLGCQLQAQVSFTPSSSPNGPNAQLINVDFGAGGGRGYSLKTGFAAIGQVTNDFWNFYDRDVSPTPYDWRSSGMLVNLQSANGAATTVGMSVSDAPGAWGDASSDSMYATYDYPLDGGNNVVTFTNLSPGQYDVLAYSVDGNYEVTVGETSYGVKTTYDSPVSIVPVWTEGAQYARWRSVTVTAGQPLVLTVRNGISGWAILSGVQVLSDTPQPSCTPAPSGLVSWWKGDGNALDSVGGDNGIVNIGTVNYVPAEVGQGFNFTSGANGLSVPDAPQLDFRSNQNFSVEAWVQPNNDGRGFPYVMDIVEKRYVPPPYPNYSTAQGWELCLVNGQLAGQLAQAPVGAFTIFGPAGPDLRDGKFHHVAMTVARNSTTGGKLYVDGQLVQTYDPTSQSGDLSNTQPMLIGNHPDPSVYGYFYGIIDEVSIYRRSLTSNEITSIYIAGSAGKCTTTATLPSINSQPMNQAVTVGGTATFSVTASGTTPLSYQWSQNTTNIPGATNATLVLNNVQIGDAGTYSVLVTNLFGSAISSNALLKVNIPPVANAANTIPLFISVSNSNAMVVLDGSLSFDLDGDSLQYYWYQTGQTNVLATGIVAVVVLPVGTNLITLVVNDGLASSQSTITVEVITIAQAVERLQAVVDSDVSHKQSLIAILNAALASIDRSNPTAAINQLQAFQNQVAAQISPLDPELAQTLIDTAQSIIDALSGGGASSHATLKAASHADGKIHLNFSGMHRQIYIIEASTNLVDWEKIGVAKDQGDGTFHFDDAGASQMPARYYRVVAP